MAGHLQDDADEVDAAANDDGSATTNEIGRVAGDEGTEEGAGGQDGDDEGVVGTGEFIELRAFDGVDEDCRASDTVDVPGIVAEEDTAEGGEGAEEVGLPGDRSLDAFDVAGCTQAARTGRLNRTSRHDGGGRSLQG